MSRSQNHNIPCACGSRNLSNGCFVCDTSCVDRANAIKLLLRGLKFLLVAPNQHDLRSTGTSKSQCCRLANAASLWQQGY